ncbi:MAG: ATP-binding cassette domain-containing protein [Firmicutes bacterium]|nr:ATP-binding cassette domain-containing protein [Bacillota bacterium]
MLKLKNVSKFYYSKGVIASGFSRVNLELAMGEFVVITGESGSGKSTLLNVLSGLDTYEEGEMYINGEETSHYNEEDFEEYRRKYVGNIFQNFNLINSYTVYQNVELALLLNGENKKDIRDLVNGIIEKVGLTEFADTKCAKLSGGQKQRVAIARALAKETPIIVADEPTGNLDSESADEVMRTLSEIAKDKLVIIVTHNIEQVEQYATRLIKMHDGKILEDKKLVEPEVQDEDISRDFKDITLENRFRIGARNAFNIPVKFTLIFFVFLFISFAVAGTYATFQKQEYEEATYGWNEFFSDTSDTRIVINKNDRSAITDDEFAAVAKLDNVKKIIKDDTLIDYTNSISNEDYWYYFYGNFESIEYFDGELDYGRMPEKPGEIVLQGSRQNYDLREEPEEILGETFYMDDYEEDGDRNKNMTMTVVGISYSERNDWQVKYYVDNSILEVMRQRMALQDSEVTSSFAGNTYTSYSGDPYFQIVASDKVPRGKAYVSANFDYEVSDGNCLGERIEIDIENTYHSESLKVNVAKKYNKNNFKGLLGLDYSENHEGKVFINSKDYQELFYNGIFQSSVYVKDAKKLDGTLAELENMGFNTLAMRDALSSDGADVQQLISMIKTFVIAALIIALFFISYFIIKIVLKSRNAYYTTIRTLGASRKISKQLLDIELMITATIAFGLFMAFMLLVYAGVINNAFIFDLAGYMSAGNYVLMYVIIIGMSYMISTRFAKGLFKNSVMSTYKEEV